MSTPTVSTLLSYANLQMAAEAIDLSRVLSEQTTLEQALILGNNRSSKFPDVLAREFATQWEVVSHKPSTDTGFSGTLFRARQAIPDAGIAAGQLVLSFRSLEFIDDYIRDGKATSELEIKEFGWAFGQIADMQAWWSTIAPQVGASRVTLTGYSLGGHLATAFRLLHPDALGNVYTFNGAGVGQVRSGHSLESILARFDQQRLPGADLSSAFTHPDVRAAYQQFRLSLQGGAEVSASQQALVGALAQRSDVPIAEIGMLSEALVRISLLHAERVRVNGYVSGMSGSPNLVPVDRTAIDATDLNYQLAVLLAGRNTSAISVAQNGLRTLRDTRLPAPSLIPGFFDVYADTYPSVVANSQIHHGTAVPVAIEDQPLYRGTILSDAREGTSILDPKLLVDRFAANDFGDTHSLVLLVDSLRVQDTLTKLLPVSARTGPGATVAPAILRAASNIVRSEASGTQGRAEGDVLENVVNGLAGLALGPSAFARLRGSLDGNTWTALEGEGSYTGRNALHELLGRVQASPLLRLIQAGDVQLELALPSISLAETARSQFGSFIALRTLSPFVVKAASGNLEEALATEWQSELADWRRDQAVASGPRGLAQFAYSDRWLAERAALLAGLTIRNTLNRDAAIPARLVGVNPSVPLNLETRRDDNGEIDQRVLVGLASESQRRQVVFGAGADDLLKGFALGDALFGGSGNDRLLGIVGADHLEGNAGDDRLVGGPGADTLLGGDGNDSYVFTASDLRESTTDVVVDKDGQGRLIIAESVNFADGSIFGGRTLELSGFVRDTSAPALQRYTSGSYVLTVVGDKAWTLSGGDLPAAAQATLRRDDDHTLHIEFGRTGARIEIRDWDNGELGISLPGYTPPTAPPGALSVSQTRDLALLQIASGVDLYSVLHGDSQTIKARLTAAPSRSGTVDRLTPAQADHVLARYQIVAQYGNDGAGFSATVFRRRAVEGAAPDANPYVIAFRGNDLQPDIAAGVPKDGGHAAMREVNQYGFAWGQLDAMERFWFGLSRGKVLDRAGQWVDLAGAQDIASTQSLVIGTGIGAHLASAFTLLHPQAVSQGVGFDGPGIGGMGGPGGAARPITTQELNDKLQEFIRLMAYRGEPLGSPRAQEFIQAGRFNQFALALEADRPSELTYGELWRYLGSPSNSNDLGSIGVPTPMQGWENFWDGANIYNSQLYQFVAQWLGRDTVGAGQGPLTGITTDGVGDGQISQAWASYTNPTHSSPLTGQADPTRLQWAGLPLDGSAGQKFTHWSLQTDRIDPAALVSGQGYGGAQQRIWVEDTLGVAAPADRAALDQASQRLGWGNNKPGGALGGTGNLTRLADSLELAALFQRIDPTVSLEAYGRIERATSRLAQTYANAQLPNARMPLAASAESRDADTLERTAALLGKFLGLPNVVPVASTGLTGYLDRDGRSNWSNALVLLEAQLRAFVNSGAQISVLDLTALTADQIGGLAMGNDAQGVAVRQALSIAAPFALVDSQGLLYAGLQVPAIRLAPEGMPGAGQGSASVRWVEDRAALLSGLNLARAGNLDAAQLARLPDLQGTTAGWEAMRWTFSDADEKTEFTFLPAGTTPAQLAALPQSLTRFGSNSAVRADRLDGGSNDDWLYGQAGPDVLKGMAGHDVLEGGAGNDALHGGSGNDELDGGAGNDSLHGGAGEDTYFFARGDGADTLYDRDIDGQRNTLVFGPGITKEQLQLAREGTSLRITVAGGGGDSIVLPQFDRFDRNGGTNVARWLEFDDGSVHDIRQLLNHAPRPAATPPADIAATVGTRVTYVLPESLFVEPDSDDKLLWQLAGSAGGSLPAGLSFDAATRKITGRPLVSGTEDLVVTVTDRMGESSQVTVHLNVAAAPTPTDPSENHAPEATTTTLPAIAAAAGRPVSVVLPQGLFTDPDVGDSLSLIATQADGSPLPDWVSFDDSVPRFVVDAPDDAVGSLDLRLLAVDLGGLAAEVPLTLEVTQRSGPRAGASLEPYEVDEDEPFDYLLPGSAFDGLGAGVSVSARQASEAPLPAWMTFDASARRLSGLTADPRSEPLLIEFVASDSEGRIAAQPLLLSVIPRNDAPAPTGALTLPHAMQGQPYAWTLPASAFSDAESGNNVAVSVVAADGGPLPAWLSFDSQTRVLSGRPGAGDVADVALTIIATDPDDATSTHAVTLVVDNVNDPPALAQPLADIQATEDQALVWEIPLGAFSDADRERLSVAVERADGSPLPAWLQFQAAAMGDPHLGRLTGTGDNAAVGTLDLRVTVRDAAGAVASDTLALRVSNINDAPVAGSALAPLSVTAYQPIDFTLPASAFVDVDLGDTLRWELRRPDGTALPSWLAFDPQTRRVTGRAVNADAGSLTLQVVAADGDGAAASQGFTLNVASGTVVNVAPAAAQPVGAAYALAGQAFEWRVADGSFTDTDAHDSLRYSATASDGTPLPGWLSFDATTRTLSGTAPANPGSLSLRITATDRDGASASQQLSLSIEPIGTTLDAGPAHDSLNGSAGSDRIDGGAGDDTLYGMAGHDILLGGVGKDLIFGHEGQDQLDGGGDGDTLHAGPGDDIVKGGVGDDALFGSEGNDRLEGGPGADGMNGGMGSDTYVFRRGDGADSIQNGGAYWTESDAATTVDQLLIHGIAPSEVRATRIQSDLQLDFGGGDSIRLTNHFFQGALVNDMSLDVIRFDDGTAWRLAEVSGLVYTTTPRRDIVWGASDRNDSIAGGDGDDDLYGNAGADTLRGEVGSDRALGEAGDDLLDGGEGIDFLEGGDGNDVLRGGAGNDGIAPRWSSYNNGGGLDGGGGDDDLDGGPGDDYLKGGPGSDLYRFGRGYGHDIVESYDSYNHASDKYTPGERDTVLFNADVLPGQVTVDRIDETLVLRIAGTGDRLDLDRYFSGSTPNNTLRVDDIRFADGTVWTGETIRGRILGLASDGDDRIQAFADAGELLHAMGGHDRVEGRGGNDTLFGDEGNDTLYGEADVDQVDGGSGDDYLDGGAGNDTLRGAEGADLAFGGDGNDLLEGGAGSDGDRPIYTRQLGDIDWSLPRGGLYGGAGNDTLDGGAGDDILVGGAGADVYRFSRGGGRDRIFAYDYQAGGDERGSANEYDVLELGTGISPGDVTLTRTGDAVVIAITGGSDQVTLEGYFRSGTTQHPHRIETLRFADGTQWADQEILARLLGNGAHPPNVTGSVSPLSAVEDEATTLVLPSGLFTDPDGDALSYGVRLADGRPLPGWITFTPGPIGQGPGSLRIAAQNEQVGSHALLLSAFDPVGFQRSLTMTLQVANRNDAPSAGQPLATAVATEGQPFVLTVPSSAFVDVDAGDVLTWSAATGTGAPLPAWLQFDAATRTFTGTPPNAAVGTLALRLQVADQGGAAAAAPLTLQVGNVNEPPQPGSPLAPMQVATYQSFSLQLPASAIVDPDTGDALTYRVARSDGSALPAWLRFDPLTLTLQGRAAASDVGTVALRLTGRDRGGLEASVPLSLNVAAGTTDNQPPTGTTLPDRRTHVGAPFRLALPLAAFADGDAFDAVTLSAALPGGAPLPGWITFDAGSGVFAGAAPASAGVFTLEVTATDRSGASTSRSFAFTVAEAQRIDGGADGDTLNGSAGNDLVVSLGGNDAIEAGAGDNLVWAGEGNDYALALAGRDTLVGEAGDDTLRGGGGDDELVGGDGSDVLFGDAGDDLIDGGPGNDQLYGREGADTYLWGRGDGSDVLVTGTASSEPIGGDLLQFEAGIHPDDLVLVREGDVDLRISVPGSADTLRLAGYFSGNLLDNPARLPRMRFADGSEWSAEEVLARASMADEGGSVLRGVADRPNALIGGAGVDDLTGGPLADTLRGGDGGDRLLGAAGDDTLDGGSGNDLLSGGPGSDLYRFGRGSGRDTVAESIAVGEIDTLQFGPGIALDDLRFVRNLHQLDIGIAGTGDVVAIPGQFEGHLLRSTRGIDRFVLADGTEISLEQIAGRIDPTVDQQPSLYGVHDRFGFEDRDDTLTGAIGTSAIEQLMGLRGNDLLDGGDGPDSLIGGEGNDTLLGGSGDDGWGLEGSGGLFGGPGNDVLRGGPGIDLLAGGPGSDTYRYTSGDGLDRIANWDVVRHLPDFTSGDRDVLEFASGILPGDVVASKEGDNLQLRLPASGGQVLVFDQFRSDATAVGAALAEVRFADGSRWTAEELIARVQLLSAGDDDYWGFDPIGDVVDGGAGSDRLRGQGGNDSLTGGEGADFIDGGVGDDTVLGGAGDDGGVSAFGGLFDTLQRLGGLYGGAGNDILDGGAGADYLEGGAGGDLFRFGVGGGHDQIGDFMPATSGGDIVQIGAPASPETLRIRRDGSSLVLGMPESDDELRLIGFFDRAALFDTTAPAVLFASGQRLTVADLTTQTTTATDGDDALIYTGNANQAINALGGNDLVETQGGADRLIGGDGNDTLASGAGDDEVDGGAGQDGLNLGDGNDIGRGGDDRDSISGGDGNDALDGGAGDDAPAYVAGVARHGGVAGGAGNDTIDGGAGADLLIGDAGDDWLRGGTGDDGSNGWYRLGTSDGGDTRLVPGIFGGDGNDTLEGGSGNDNLSGGAGSDTYVFGRGDGIDRILDRYHWNPNVELPPKPPGERDVIAFGTGIAPQDVRATRQSYDLVLTITGSNDEVRVESYFSNDRVEHDFRFEKVRFDNGTEWLAADILARVAVGTSGDDVIYGAAGMTTLQGLEGNDYIATGSTGISLDLVLDGGAGDDLLRGYGGSETLLGGSGNDVLESGAGDDLLDGGSGNDSLDGAGNDVLIFGRGYGRDVARPHGSGPNDRVTVRMKSDLQPQDILVRRDGANVELKVNGSSDALVLHSAFASGSLTAVFDRIEFASGAVWTPSHLAALSIQGTAADDLIDGFSNDETIGGLAGNDRIHGQAGNDLIAGGDGNDVLQGGPGDDTLEGGPGSDILAGGTYDNFNGTYAGPGNDLYRFGLGDGQDSIHDFDTTIGNTDSIVFETGVAPDSIQVSNEAGSLVLKLAGGADQLRVVSYFTGQGTSGWQVEELRFADAPSTVWRYADVLGRLRDGGPGDDTITGLGTDDVLRGYGGNDVLDGQGGNDSLQGDGGDDRLSGGGGADLLDAGDGNDIVLGQAGPDLLLGGAGNDRLFGHIDQPNYDNGAGGNGDTYDGGPGDDELRDQEATDGDVYKLYLGSGTDIVSDFGGSADRIAVGAGLMPSQVLVRVDNGGLMFRAAGGADSIRVSGLDTIEEVSFVDGTAWDLARIRQEAVRGTSGSDTLLGFSGADIVDAGDGDDVAITGAGSDALAGGDGNDRLYGNTMSANYDNGASGNGDRYDGGRGNDELADLEASDNDSYAFSVGGGVDTVRDFGGLGDRILVGAGVSPEDLIVRREDQELVLRLPGGERLTVFSAFDWAGNSGSGSVEGFTFADGTSWDLAAIRQATLRGEAGVDTLYGYEGADTITGAEGSDNLFGGGGDDTLRGQDGDDTLGGDAGNDLLDGGAGSDTAVFIAVVGSAVVTRAMDGRYTVAVGDGVDTLQDVEVARFAGVLRTLTTGGVVVDQAAPSTGIPLNADSTLGNNAVTVTSMRWQVLEGGGWVDIAGATSSSFTPRAAQVDKPLRAVATFTDPWGAGQQAASAATAPVLRGNLPPEGQLQVSGSATEGQTLTAVTGSVVDPDGIGNFSYQWTRDGVDVTGAAEPTYALDDADVGRQLRVRVSWTDGLGYRETLTSSPTEPIANVNDAPVGTPTLEGTASENETLRAVVTAITDPDGLGNMAYQWLRGGVPIVGATASSHLLTDADVAMGVSVRVTYADGFGSVETLSSPESQPVQNINDPPTGSVALTGAVATGQTLVASRAFGDEDGVGTIEWSWQRSSDGNSWVAVAGATGPSLLLTEAHVASRLRGVARYVDGHGTEETVYSAATIPVPGQTLNTINGTAASESLSGTSAADAINGLAGADTLYGRESGDALSGGPDNDVLYGEAGNDTLDGGSGNDFLDGGFGNNTYLFGRGDGSDIVNYLTDSTPGKVNTIAFKEGVAPSDVIPRRIYDSGFESLELSIAGTADKITARYFFYANDPSQPINPVQQLRFADGTVWDVATIKAKVFEGTSGADVIAGTISADSITGQAGADALYGREANDSLFGGGDNDTLYGEAGNDVLDGGAGNDVLDGGFGNNTYLFGRGDGLDLINYLTDGTPGKLNTIAFKEGVAPSDVIPRRIYDSGFESLELSIAGTADKLTTRYFFYANDPSHPINPVQQLRFADGTVWDIAAIKSKIFEGTSGADTIAGTTAADSITGQAGADALYGREGSDSLFGGADNDTLYGEAGNDTLDGGTGNDFLDGGFGNNTYLFGRGDGSDIVNYLTDGTPGKLNTIAFKEAVAPSDVIPRRIYDSGFESLELSIAGSADKITARYFFYANDPSQSINPVQQLRFADGTVWDLATIKNKIFEGTSGADTIAGTIAADSITGQAGADALYGREGNDSLLGGADNDTLYGEAGSDALDGSSGNDTIFGDVGNDTLDGGAGNDFLDGGFGNNTYLFGRGDGSDIVNYLTDGTPGKLNSIAFKEGVAPSDVIARRIYDSGFESLELSIVGTADKITARYFFYANDPSQSINPVQQLRFADGTVWDIATIKAKVFEGTSGADTIAGTTGTDSIAGQAGADALYGREGSDSLFGGADNDTLYGEAGNDTLDGGSGNDFLDGGFGNNTYLFGRGDGSDIVNYLTDSTPGKLNSIAFKEGVAPSDVIARRIYDSGYESLELSIAGAADKLTVRYFFYANDPSQSINPVQQLRFADGTVWDIATIKAKVFEGTSGADTIAGTTGTDSIAGQAGADALYGREGNDSLFGGADNDTLYGEAGNDTLDGGSGNDTLLGGPGNDAYAVGRGSGAEVLTDQDGTTGNSDSLLFGEGVASNQIWFRRVASDLEVSIIGTGDKVTIANWYSGSNYRVERFASSDGKLLLDSQVEALVSAMASFAPPAMGQTDLPTDYQTSLSSVITSNWQTTG